LLKLLRRFYRLCIQAKHEGLRNHKAVLDILKYIADTPQNLLDIGCAEGFKTIDYAKTLSIPNERVYGIEIKPKFADLAKKHFNLLNIDLEKESFPAENQVFDLIICNQTLEHLKNIFLPLSEIDRTLKVGGHLVIGIPNLASLYNRIILLLGYQPKCNEIVGPHIRCFTHKGFLGFIRLNDNFMLMKLRGATLYPFPYPFVESCAKYCPGFSCYLFYLLKKIKHDPPRCGWDIKKDFDTNF